MENIVQNLMITANHPTVFETGRGLFEYGGVIESGYCFAALSQ